MIYSPRLKKILEICLQQNEDIPFDRLAQELKISRRTLFRELADVDLQLKQYQISLSNRNGKGIRLAGTKEHKELLLNELNIKEIQYLNKEERRNLLIFELLRNETIEKLIHYATMFQVSEATISNDLDVIDGWLKLYDIALFRKPGIGVELQSEEANRRRAMTAIVNETLQRSNEFTGVNYLDSQLLLEQIFLKAEKDSIMKLLNQEILERILMVFHHYQHELSLDKYAQTSYIGLIIHLVIAIDRILKDEELEDNPTVLAMVQDNAAYETAKQISSVLEMEFDIQIPQGEIAFIALHIKGAKITYLQNLQDAKEDTLKIHDVIGEMLESYAPDIRCQLSQDEQFLQGLITHLEPTITRLQNQLPIYNPLLEPLKQQYEELFIQTKNACKCLEQRFHCIVSDDEVGFLTMHVGAALERMPVSQKRRIVELGVVCASGIGVSALLSARIGKSFHGDVHLKTLSMDALAQGSLDTIELLVSTFPLTHQEVPCIQVSPLLNDEDMETIQKEIRLLQQQPRKVLPILEGKDFESQLRHIHQASAACLEVLRNLKRYNIPAFATMKEVIQEVSHLLAREELMQQDISNRLTEREQLGSIIIKEYGFALLHARVESIQECSVCLLYPEHEWKGELADIKVIIVLLMSKNHTLQQQEVLSLITRSISESDDFLHYLKEGNEQSIRQILQRLLKQYLYNEE